MAWGLVRSLHVACLVWFSTHLLLSAHALEDNAQDLNKLDVKLNIVLATNGPQAEVEQNFDGDANRFARQAAARGTILYKVPDGIEKSIIVIFVQTSDSEWTTKFSLGKQEVLSLSSAQLQDQLKSSSEAKSNGTGYSYDFKLTSDGWAKGTLTIDGQQGGSSGCETDLKIILEGGAPSVVQVGNVDIQEVKDKSTCTDNSTKNCNVEYTGAGECPAPPEDSLRIFLDRCEGLQQLFSNNNIRVADGDGFGNDKLRLARRDTSSPAAITYKFDAGGIQKIRASVVLNLANDNEINSVNITVKPYLSNNCIPSSEYLTNFEKLLLHEMENGWKFVEIEYTVAPSKALNCDLAKFVEIKFFAPPPNDVQLLELKLIGNGTIQGLQEIDNIDQSTGQKQGWLEGNMIVWILIGVGTIFLLILIGLVWCCCSRSCCGQQEHGVPPNSMGKNGGVELNKMTLAQSRMQLQGQVVIPVDCVVPDMPAPMDDDSAQLHTLGHKFPTGHGYHRHDLVGRKNSISAQGGQYVEPVVDLSVPVHAQPDHMGAGFAPRQGQDIFDTWQQAGLSGYHSGEDYDASGPLDTRERSFTGNPPVSSTGNTSPTQESSVIGVTAQLGMRLKELKSLQGEHERLAKGQADSNGDLALAPEPLGVKYGRKIGVGGFGAVYEGEWAGKTVAIKVIKMPHTAKATEDKEKMAFMEYAISGILLHNNIVQTYQADIRPVFLDDDTETNTVSRSGWTGLGEFLSNDAISQKMHKSMRIQEWELRLVMEYCNKGNLKEAIRQKLLMTQGSVKALEVALLALDIARACQAIHKHNIIHGDLKPHNVLLTQEGDDERGWIGKIADFGLSVKIKRGEQHVSGIQHGTEGYVAPEVLQTRRMVKASDVYSFGIIMWELWHARLYYEEYRHAQRRMRRVTLDFRPTFERGCPEEWINLAKSCWALRPEERPDFDRVVKMMRMIIASIRDKVNDEGVITELY